MCEGPRMTKWRQGRWRMMQRGARDRGSRLGTARLHLYTSYCIYTLYIYILVPWGVLLWDGPHCVCFPPMASHCFTIPQLQVGKHGNKQCSMQMQNYCFCARKCLQHICYTSRIKNTLLPCYSTETMYFHISEKKWRTCFQKSHLLLKLEKNNLKTLLDEAKNRLWWRYWMWFFTCDNLVKYDALLLIKLPTVYKEEKTTL